MWLDSSVRLITRNLNSLLSQVRDAGGVGFLTNDPHSTVALTEPTMFKYFPSNKKQLSLKSMVQAGNLIIYRTHETWKHFLRWMLICSLIENCIAPTYNFGGKKVHCKIYRTHRYSGCHRFDQSLANILTRNWHQYNKKRSRMRGHWVRIIRKPTNLFQLQTCTSS